MDKAVLTMLENLKEKTGHSLDEWKDVITKNSLSKHGEIVKFLKEKHNITHGYASEIALKVLGSDADSTTDTDGLIVSQYKGKEHLKPYYDKLLAEIQKFDGEFEIAPKKGYDSLRRKKQFAMIGPATNARVEVGINMKGVDPTDRLEQRPAGEMCQYKVKVTDDSQVDAELFGWIKTAFDSSG